MEEDEKTPLLFANQVVHKFVDNLLGRGIESKQIESIRVVFRRCGGEWSRIVYGDPVHVGLLIRLVQAWGRTVQEKQEVANA